MNIVIFVILLYNSFFNFQFNIIYKISIDNNNNK